MINKLSFAIMPICEACKHFEEGVSDEPQNPDIDEVNPQAMRCRSFPTGIPNEIWMDANPHSEPVGGEVEEDGEPLIFKPVDDLGILNWVLENRGAAVEMLNEVIAESAKRVDNS